MNRSYAAFAASALMVGAVILTAPGASATLRDPGPTPSAVGSQPPAWPDEGSGYPGVEEKSPEYNYPEYKLDVPAAPSTHVKPSSASVSGTTTRAVEAGASAIGGAGIALVGMWLVRRRGALAR
jgi:hypothetical protein